MFPSLRIINIYLDVQFFLASCTLHSFGLQKLKSGPAYSLQVDGCPILRFVSNILLTTYSRSHVSPRISVMLERNDATVKHYASPVTKVECRPTVKAIKRKIFNVYYNS
jgi:hypothetical protein